MKRHVPIIGFSLALVCSFIWADTALADRRVVLVIGNSAYQHAPALPYPVKDARAIAAMFEKAGFAVVTARYDASNLQFKEALRQFEDAAGEADIAVVYYAGHTINIHGVNYLIPVDAKLASDRDADDEAITLERLLESVDAAKQLRLVILDACRDNPFVRTMRRLRVPPLDPRLGKVQPTTVNTLVAFATKGCAPANDGDGDHSPYTSALLHNLFVPGLDVRLAFGRARDEALRSTSNRQEPFVYGSLTGTNVSLVRASELQPAAPAMSEGQKGDYDLIAKIGTKGAWEAFLAQHPTGFYADLAREQLAKLVPQQTRRIALVIGNATYADDSKPLAAPIKDAGALADELRRIGFDAVLGEDLTKEQMRSVIDTFQAKIAPGVTALLFFSGYGIQTGKQSYVISVDAQIRSESDVKRDGYSVEAMLSAMHAAGATVKIVIIDAARRNPFEQHFRGSPAGLAALNAPAGTLAIYSAAPDRTLGEVGGDGSVFVSELVKEMRSPGLTAQDVFDSTRIKVSRASRRAQVPRVWASLNYDFFFTVPSASAPSESVTPAVPTLAAAATRPVSAAAPSEAGKQPTPSVFSAAGRPALPARDKAPEPLATAAINQPPQATKPLAPPARPRPPTGLLWWWPQWN
jgi:uncharacterized caspase-like protein